VQSIVFSLRLLELIVTNMKIDSAVAKFLEIDPSKTTISAAGGGGCSSASIFKITTMLEDGTDQLFFMKTSNGKDAEVMFQGISPSTFLKGPCPTSSSGLARDT
jgi:hypothetical protein